MPLAVAGILLTGVAALVISGHDTSTDTAITDGDRRVMTERADRSQQRPAPEETVAGENVAEAPADTPVADAVAVEESPAPPPPPPPPPPAWVSPVEDYSFTSGYGHRWGTVHAGVDLANGTGTLVRSAAAGTVELATSYDWGGYGYTVIINHGDGIKTLYGHNSQVLVTPGQQVAAGQNIAHMGSTGNSTGPHLHFEVHLTWGAISNGNAVDPQVFMRDHGVNL